MKLMCDVDLVILAKLSKDSADGQKKYRSLTVYDPNTSESGSLSCSEEVFENCSPDFSKLVTVHCEFNDKYGSFRAVGIK